MSRPEVSFQRMSDFAHQSVVKSASFFGSLASCNSLHYSQGPWMDFDAKNNAKTRGSEEGCAFSGL